MNADQARMLTMLNQKSIAQLDEGIERRAKAHLSLIRDNGKN
jgi:hypothetical protein